MRPTLAALTLAVLPALRMATPALADATEPIKIHEFPVPWKDSRPRDPDFVSPTEVWFVGQTGLDPAAGRIWFGTDANTIGYAQVN